jgi:hypothetical protein
MTLDEAIVILCAEQFLSGRSLSQTERQILDISAEIVLRQAKDIRALHTNLFADKVVEESPVNTAPQTVEFTREEGGDWEPFKNHQRNGDNRVHSIRFADGRVWDAYNGWRTKYRD